MTYMRKDYLRMNGTLASRAVGLSFLFVLFFQVMVNAQNQKPNLIILHTDEQNFRTLGCYRETLDPSQAYLWGTEEMVETPNIDALAEKGTLLTSFYANTPVCSPSRSSFVSGLYPQNTPVKENDIKMNSDIVTFAAELKNDGYKTGYAGKWHLNGTGKPQWDPNPDFGFTNNDFMFNRGHWKRIVDNPEPDQSPSVYGKVSGADSISFTTDYLTNKAVNFVKANKSAPFCYMVSYPDPHGPNTVRSPYDTMFNDVTFQLPPTARKSPENLPQWAKMNSSVIGSGSIRKYMGMIKCIDDNIGRLIDSLEVYGVLENTIIVFTSDHGDMLGEHKRDNKGIPFEASAKVPFIVRYPKAIKEGAVVNNALSCVDFKPTILSLMGVKPESESEGRDASGLFQKSPAGEHTDDFAFIRGTGNSSKKGIEDWVGVVTDRYKLIYAPESDPWLIDLSKDPDEIINYYTDKDYQEIVSELTERLKVYGEESNDPWLKDPAIKSAVDGAITLVSPNSVEQKYNISFELYPNPAEEMLSLKGIRPNGNFTYKIVRIDGRVEAESVFDTGNEINVAGLNKGFYFFRLLDNKGNVLSTKTFIKK